MRVPLWVTVILIALGGGIGLVAADTPVIGRTARESSASQVAEAEKSVRKGPPAVFWTPPISPEVTPAGRPYMAVGAEVGDEATVLPQAPIGLVLEGPARPVAEPTARAAVPSAPSPVRRLSADQGVRMPLLALRRADRLVFHETLLDASAPPDGGIEGEWAVPGRCAEILHMNIAQPVRSTGQVRGVGRTDAADSWTVGPAVPRQACSASSSFWLGLSTASDADRAAFGSLAGIANGPAALDQLVRHSDSEVWLRFRSEIGTRVLLVRRLNGEWIVGWDSGLVTGAEGLDLLGTYRRGSRPEAWVVVTDRGRPRAFLRVVRQSSGEWVADSPALL